MDVDCVIGIDPGLSGAISVWKPNEAIRNIKMPRNITDILEVFTEEKKSASNIIIFLEKVQLRPDDMHGGKAFAIQKMLDNFRDIKNAIELAGIPFVMAHPMSWQSYLNLRRKGEEKPERKRRYKVYAQECYPEVKATLWNCDAMLLVHFGRKKLMNDSGWIYENIPAKFHDLLN